jgi:hypothetical protein
MVPLFVTMLDKENCNVILDQTLELSTSTDFHPSAA